MADNKSSSRVVQVANIVVPFVAGTVFAILFQEMIKQGAMQWASLYLMLISFCLAFTSGIIYLLFRDMNELVKRVGVKVSYLEQERDSANLYRRAKEIVEKTERSICILNSPVEASESLDKDEQAGRERQLYYESLLEQVRRGKGKIKYERFLQVKDGHELKSVTVSKEYHTHLRLCCVNRNGSSLPQS